MNLYDVIPDNFFSLLSSKNRSLYVAAILETFKVYEMGSILGIDKKIIIDDLAHYFECINSSITEIIDTDELDPEDDEDISSKKSLAYFVVRRMSECGWIYVDITNDYVEIVNFYDYAITFIEALMDVYPFSYADDSDELYIPNKNEYQGYIFTIYSLLAQTEVIDSQMLLSQVYSNTKMLIRSLRKLDSRLKDYITSVIDNSEIKDLMDRLVQYKSELFDLTYAKIKTSDNINKYRLAIVEKLESFQNDDKTMHLIALDYLPRFKNDEALALKKANRDIDEIIDVFNSIDDIVSEIDLKNKTYINSTIGKVKFLLAEEDNVIGKLNTILKFIKDENKQGHIDKALKTITPLYSLAGNKSFRTNESLYAPRGSYSHNYNQILDMSRFDSVGLERDFANQFYVPYNEVEVRKFLEFHLVDGELQGSKLIAYDSDDEFVLNVIFCLLYVTDIEYDVIIPEGGRIEHQKFSMKDFIIRRKRGNE